MIWENQCAHLDNLGPTVDGGPWEEADIKCRRYIYLCLGAECQRKETQYYPDLKNQEITTNDFWERLRRLFVKKRNVTFDRYEAFTWKQEKTETIEQYHCSLTELLIKWNSNYSTATTQMTTMKTEPVPEERKQQ